MFVIHVCIDVALHVYTKSDNANYSVTQFRGRRLDVRTVVVETQNSKSEKLMQDENGQHILFSGRLGRSHRLSGSLGLGIGLQKTGWENNVRVGQVFCQNFGQARPPNP